VNQTELHEDVRVEVYVKSLKTNDRTHFKVQESATIGHVWIEAVNPEHLNEQRTPGDTFRCDDGTDLTNRLDTTLEQLETEGVCRDRQFEIRGPSGGA
jgi:ribosome-binding factor A